MEKKNPWWIVAISILGSFNRETSLLIPGLYYFSQLDYSKGRAPFKMLFEDKKVVLVTGASLIGFFAVFVGIRSVIGYIPAEGWRVSTGLPMLKLNLMSPVGIKTYMELFGVLGFLPFVAFLFFRRLDFYLKVFLVVLVPIWFGIHLSSVVSYQARMFLVPSLLVFLPSALQVVDQIFESRSERYQNQTV